MRNSHAKKTHKLLPEHRFGICKGPDLGISLVYYRNEGDVEKGKITQDPTRIMSLVLVHID
jgi:hypothetical protein